MIKLKNPAFLAVSENLQTPRLIEKLSVDYKTRTGTKQVVVTPSEPILNEENEVIGHTDPTFENRTQGYITAWLNDNNGNRVLDGQEEEAETYQPDNIIKQLHHEFKAQLEELNPNVEFELSSEFK